MKTMLFFSQIIFILAVSSFSSAQNCSSGGDQKVLHLSYPDLAGLESPVSVQIHLEGRLLIADFDVRSETINASPVLGPNEYPYQQDVVELFLSVAGNQNSLPYYEFELSPYDNTFTVRVDDLKKPFAENLDLGLQHSVVRTESGWTAHMAIPLDQLGWDGDANKLVGNAYSILGVKGGRKFWSLFLPVQKKPNFHKPEFFKSLLSCP